MSYNKKDYEDMSSGRSNSIFFNMAGEMDLAVRWGTILHLTGNQFSILLLKLM